MAINNEKITAFINALKAKFELKGNKVTSFGQTPSDDKYPSEKLVKDSLDEKISTSSTAGLVKNDGTIDTTSYLTASDITDKEDVSNKVTSFATSTNNLSDSKYPSEKLVKTELDKKIDISSTSGLVKNDGTIDTTTYLSEHQSLSDVGGVIDVEKQAEAESGYAATYVIKQGSSSSKSQVGVKINIPKDFLVKSGSVKTVGASGAQTAAQLGTGYSTGDKYIDFVINTKEDDGTDEHIYINVKDLVEDTTYDADNTTLELSNGIFAVKEDGITTTELADSIVESLGYADDYHSSAAASITSTDINNWNAKSELTSSDVDSQIEAALTSLTNNINAIS